MTAGQQIAGVATYGRPRTACRRPVEYTAHAPTCVCFTDRDTSPCPQNCPTREIR
ncbi:hypothetical protein ACH4T9_12825 [Micromonospora sp. NPDC020750]|uniref:hypothetical protein n=1 Tax=unclassified Micromonospora TaxID=2617518 RepID=UPI003787B46D